jgi:hypothetical protein
MNDTAVTLTFEKMHDGTFGMFLAVDHAWIAEMINNIAARAAYEGYRIRLWLHDGTSLQGMARYRVEPPIVNKPIGCQTDALSCDVQWFAANDIAKIEVLT